MDKLLKDVEARGKVIQSIEARLKRTLIRGLWGNKKKTSTGRLVFQRPDRFRIDLEKPRRESYICDGQSVYEMKWSTKQIVEHTIPAEQRGRYLDRPPVNFLIGGKAADAKKLYAIAVLAEDEKTIAVKLRPRPGQEKQCDFIWAKLTFNKKDLIPVKVERELREQKKTREIHEFDHVKVNGGVKPAEFAKPSRPGRGWTWETNPLGKPK